MKLAVPQQPLLLLVVQGVLACRLWRARFFDLVLRSGAKPLSRNDLHLTAVPASCCQANSYIKLNRLHTAHLLAAKATSHINLRAGGQGGYFAVTGRTWISTSADCLSRAGTTLSL